MCESSRTGSQHKGSGENRPRGRADSRLKPDVSEDFLMLQLSLLNMNLLSCFLGCLLSNYILQTRSFYRDRLPGWLSSNLFSSHLCDRFSQISISILLY